MTIEMEVGGFLILRILISSQQTGQQGFDTEITLLSKFCFMHQIYKRHDDT